MLSISHVFSVFVLATLGVSAQAQGNQTDTPFALQSPGQLVQCKNTTIVWQGGQSPYKVTLKPVCGAGQNASEETHSVLTSGSTSIEIPIHFPKDTPLTISITDSTNMQATAPQTIVESGDADDSCTTQTACTDATKAPSAPVAVADPSSQPAGTGFPTDRLITAGSSATPAQAQSMTDTYSSGSTMVIVYSYASQTPTPSASAEPSQESQPNSAIPASTAPTFVVGLIAFVSANLALSLW